MYQLYCVIVIYMFIYTINVIPWHPFCLLSPFRPYRTMPPYCPAVPKHREMGQRDTGQ